MSPTLTQATTDCPVVSAVIVTFDRPMDILSRAVDSVINQSYLSMEIIVVNSSINKLHEKAVKFTVNNYNSNGHPIKYVASKLDLNASAARNLGASQSIG